MDMNDIRIGKHCHDSIKTLRETHRLLSDVHGMTLSLINSCEEYRFEVVDADRWFNRITGGGDLAKLEDELGKLRDWAQEAHANVRLALDRIEDKEEDEQ